MNEILVGSASWTDKSLIAAGTFYPEKSMSAEGRLRYYASRFPIVEVDSTYYALPSGRTSQLWVERTPEHFVMHVKAFRVFTGHHTQPEALPKDLREALNPPKGKNLYYKDVPTEIADELWRRYWRGIDPLRVSGRLGLVLFQFPPWVFYSRKGFDHIVHCQEKLPGMRLAIEFRHKSWFEGGHAEETLAFERDHDLVHVVVDEPQGFANSIPALWEATTATDAYVRLHGRNAATWNLKGLASSGERFNYLYPAAELEAIAASVVSLSRSARRTHVFFNNNYGDYGVRNAAELSGLVARRAGAGAAS